MGLKCQISYSNTGQAIVTDSTGNISQLYTDALALTQNQEAALNIWASAFTPEFEQTFGKVAEGTEPPVLQVIKFYQSLKQLDGRLTTSEVFEAKQMMRSAGIRSLSDLSATLKDIFLYGDIPTVDTQRAIESGLFLPEDLPNIDLPKVVDFITRLEGETLYNDFEVEPENSQIKYRNTANKNILGASEFVTIEQIDAEIIDLIDDFQSEDEFYGKIQELPYTDFVARFYEDTAFAQDFISRFNGMAKVPVGEEVNGEIIVENVTTTAKTVKNTILDGLDALDINADISFINSIADNVWDSNVEAVTKVVKEIESELATKNIDIVGLHKVTTDKATLVEILDAVATMVANPTVQNIDNFAAIYDKTFLKQPAKKVVKVPTELQGLSLVSLTSPKTDQQLFEEHGLIKVGDNLYHKISLEADISDAYEYLYQQMQDGNFEIPYQYRTETNLDNKTGVLQDIAEYVNGRDTGLGYYNETASLYQLVFNHPKIDTNKMADDTTSALNTIRTDEVYLKTDFVSDFYGMILQEKIKDSALYRNTLSKIGVTDNDLTITSDLIGDLTNIPMYQEFMDYMKLRKSEDMKKYLPSTMYGDTNQALAAYNFPQTIEQYTGPTAEVENVLVTAPTAEDFIRVGENVYQKVKNSETASVFLRLKNNTNPAYYTTQPAFANYTQEQIDRAANTDMVSNSELTTTDVANRKEKSGIQSRIVTRIKARNKQVADPANQRNTQAFENNLIEFLRQKGVPVVTDAVAIRTALQQLGIDNVNQMFGFSDMGVQETASITINGNRVTVAPRQGGKVSTQAQAYAISTSIYEKINKYLRENAGDLYRPNMVLRSGNTIITNIPADLASRVQALRELGAEIDSIVAQQRKENAIPEPDRVAEELQRGVSPEVLKDLGYNMLETPAGNILGFEYQGTIYLDPANISNITTLHELIHVFQKMTNIKAEAGDEMAQKILQKKENVFGDMAREWEMFHRLTAGVGSELNPVILGEKGAAALDVVNEATFRIDNLRVAREMEQAEKTPQEIRVATGWEKGSDGLWRYEELDGNLKITSFEDLEKLLENKEKTTGGFVRIPLTDLLEIEDFSKDYLNAVQNISVYFDKAVPIGQAYLQSMGIHINRFSAKYNEDFTQDNALDNFRGMLLHELQHYVQREEGFSEPFSEEEFKFRIEYEIDSAKEELEKIKRISEFEPSYKELIKPQEGVIKSLETKRNTPQEELDNWYWKSYGEIEARNVQTRMNMTLEQRRQTLLSQTEDVAKEDQIMFQTAFYYTTPFENGERNQTGITEQERQEKAATEGIKNGEDTAGQVLSRGNIVSRRVRPGDTVQDDLSSAVESLLSLPQQDILENQEQPAQGGDFVEAIPGVLYRGTTADSKIKTGFYTPNKTEADAYGEGGRTLKMILNPKAKVLNILTGNYNTYDINPDGVAEYERLTKTTYLPEGVSETLWGNTKERKALIAAGYDAVIANTIDGYAVVVLTDKAVTEYSNKKILDQYKKDKAQGRATALTNSLERLAIEQGLVQNPQVQSQATKDILDILGIDLSAPVYAQRPGESNEDYHTRLVNEVEAYVTAPEIAEKLENLRQSNPGIWSKIVDFLKNLKAWLASQIGFQDYQGDILEMTKEQYTSALGVSILKDSYDDLFIPQTGKKIANEVMNAAAVLDSQVEIIPLQTDEVQDTLFDKIDNCG